MSLTEHVVLIKEELDRHWRCGSDTRELWRHIFNLEREVAELEAERDVPAHIEVTASQEGQPMGSYNIGTTVNLTATVKNDKGANIADTLSWTSDQGTVTAGPDGVDANGAVVMTAQLVNVPAAGTVNVVATTSNGLAFTDAITFTDPADAVPASIDVTDAAA